MFLTKETPFLEQSTNKNDLKRNLILIVAQIFELIGLATYKINSGDRPEFFIRINNESELVKMTKPFYDSSTLTKIRNRHENAKNIMTHFFLNLENNEDRWKLIE